MQNDVADTPSARTRAPGGGRKKNFDTDEVLARALDVFWKHGFNDTTTRQLEEELGLTASSIYNAYGSKGELLDAAVDRYLDKMDEFLLRPLRTAPDPLVGLETFFQQIAVGIDGDHRSGCLIVTLLTDNAGRNETVLAHTDRYLSTLRHELAASLEQATKMGLIAADTVGGRLELLIAVVLGINAAARGRMGNATVEAMADAMCDQIRAWRRD